MKNNNKDISKLHDKFEEVVNNNSEVSTNVDNKIRYPYEFLASVDRGWIPCDILEIDSEKELANVIFPHPDAVGWMETCAGGIFDQVVELWRVRLRED